MTTPDLFASGEYVRASEAPPPGRARAGITVNTDEWALREMARAREASLSGLIGALDNKRPRAWDQYGYPETVTFAAMLKAYERGGVAHGAVHRLLDKCWAGWPRIKQPDEDEETDWETKVKELFKARDLWRKLRDLDRRNMIGRYAAIIYRVADGQPLSAPLVRARELVDIVPLYEDQIRVQAWNTDTASPDYGLPMMFQYRSRPPNAEDRQGQPEQWVDVHPSRIQILAEGAVGSDFFDGVPLLRAGFNSLVDLEKISGGSAEGFLKNSARTVVVKLDAGGSMQHLASTPGQALPTGADISTKLNDKVRDLNRNIDAAMLVQGGDASTLQTSQITPGPSFEVAGNMFAASVRMPFTVLFGQQTGRLASDEDNADFMARAQSRQNNELTPMLDQFVTRMQAAGIIDAGEFEIEWPPLDAPGEADQLANAKTMAEINEINSRAGQSAVFDANEIRGVAQFEERDELEDIPLEGEDEEEAAAAAQPQRPAMPPVRAVA